MNMTPITLLDDVEVKLIDSMASDISVTRSAQVSVKGENKPETDTPRLINYLLSNRHMSPFEHATFTFFIKAPIFVFREFHRHRAGWSYNEMSGRYTQLLPEFYVPASSRPLSNSGTSARPEFTDAPHPDDWKDVTEGLAASYQVSWAVYEELLDMGVANEVARMILPVGVMSQMYATCNARSLMHFLSLRTDDPDASVRSRPQLEIEMVARKMEAIFAEKMPYTYEAFVKNGRVV